MAGRQPSRRKHDMIIDSDLPITLPPRKKRCEQADRILQLEQHKTQGVRDLCRFFQCPREIRDMVYHHLWKHTPYMLVACDVEDSHKDIARIGAKISALYDSWPEVPEGPKRALPQWLLASKQMLTEGIEQFQHNGVWCVFTPNALSGDMFMQPLLHAATATNLIVYMTSLCTVYHLELYPADIRRKWITGENDCLESLYNLLLGNGDDVLRLKVLEFRTTVRYLKLGYHPHLYSFLRALEDASEDDTDGEYGETEGEEEEDGDSKAKDGAANSNDATHESAGRNLFDFSSLELPARISSNLSRFQIELRYQDDDAQMPSTVESMMCNELWKLGRAMIGQCFRVFVGFVERPGDGRPRLVQRLEFKRESISTSREYVRSAMRLVWVD